MTNILPGGGEPAEPTVNPPLPAPRPPSQPDIRYAQLSDLEEKTILHGIYKELRAIRSIIVAVILLNALGAFMIYVELADL